jgi:hypothetical protein
LATVLGVVIVVVPLLFCEEYWLVAVQAHRRAVEYRRSLRVGPQPQASEVVFHLVLLVLRWFMAPVHDAAATLDREKDERDCGVPRDINNRSQRQSASTRRGEVLRSKPSAHSVEYLLALSHIFKTLNATNKGIR